MKNKNALLVTLAAVVVIALGLYGTTLAIAKNAGDEQVTATAPAAGEEPEVTPAETAAAPEAESATETANGNAQLDLEAAMADRALGDPKAPVRVDEYASLTCSHCAAFSNEIFDNFKKKYIDTGKVYFVFHDFPLNAPAIDAAMIARCMPADRYFQFTKFLFQTQDKWAYGTTSHRDVLRQNAKLLGMNDESIDACWNNADLKLALIDHMQKAGEKYKIDSTPSFVINQGAETISGMLPLTSFDKKLAPYLNKQAAPLEETKAQ